MADTEPHTCPTCGGNSVYEDKICPTCHGEGALPAQGFAGRSFAELKTSIDDILTPSLVFRSYLIVEALDTTEYNALTDAQKLNFIMIVSAGFVDLNTDSNAKALLMALFGAGTTTRANLIELIS